MKELVFWTWCLPQSLLGSLTYLALKCFGYIEKTNHYKKVKLVFIKPLFSKGWSGSSCGKFIFLNKRYLNAKNQKALRWLIQHEYGHTKQNFILGPLYLPIVGLSSGTLFLLSRISPKYRAKYHTLFPENWANKLAKIGPPPSSLGRFKNK